MISYQEAINILREHAAPFDSKELDLMEVAGKIAAASYASDRMIPSFRNAAMDGFALNCKAIPQDLQIEVQAAVPAGDSNHLTGSGCAYEIATGAMVPDGCDAVIPVEDVTVLATAAAAPICIRLHRKPSIGENIRSPGEDFSPGAPLLTQGQLITPEIVMALAVHGIRAVRVYQLPPLHIIATGNEITEPGAGELAPGKIYNSNAPYLMAAYQVLGLECVYHGIVADDQQTLQAVLEDIPPGAIIITTGAVSMGRWDLVPAALKAMGGSIHFHKVQIRPGKPILFASLPNRCTLFGLPGNPVSTAIGFRFFVTPFLRFGLGLSMEEPSVAALSHPHTKKNKLKQFLKASWRCNAPSTTVEILAGQESFKIRPLLEGNAWAVLREEQSDLPVGATVSVYPFIPCLSIPPHLAKEPDYEYAA